MTVMQMPQMMGNPWLPSWLGFGAATVFTVIAVVHLWHMIAAPVRVMMWHLGHVLMALGMIVMSLPTSGTIVSAGAGEVAFALAAVTTGTFLIVEFVRGRPLGELWLILAVDLAAMVYMFALPTTPLTWLTLTLVTWFALQAIGWTTGPLSTLAAHGGLGGSPQTGPAQERATAPATQPSHSGPTRRLASSGAGPATAGPATRLAHPQLGTLTIRITLTVMSLGMAYMLLAMQFGMSDAMPGMGGMHHGM